MLIMLHAKSLLLLAKRKFEIGAIYCNEDILPSTTASNAAPSYIGSLRNLIGAKFKTWKCIRHVASIIFQNDSFPLEKPERTKRN